MIKVDWLPTDPVTVGRKSQLLKTFEGYSQNPKPRQNLGRHFENLKNEKKDDL